MFSIFADSSTPSQPDMNSLLLVLQDKFALSQFRKGQAEIISDVLRGRDVMAILPTGGGKSLCYQLPALVLKKLVVVISPLIALMNDQVLALKKRGIPTGCIHSGLSLSERAQVFADMKRYPGFILYLSPERVQKEGFQTWIKLQNVGVFAIDEAHCISQWGHDFRPEYALLASLKDLMPKVPILALTASATPLVRKDVEARLKLNNAASHVHGFYRPNLYYQVELCADAAEKKTYLRGAIASTPQGRILVYTGTRKEAEGLASEWQNQFSDRFGKVNYYHAGLSSDTRAEVQGAYRDGEIRILFATNAFGMGVDQPDVRLVVHFSLPAEIDSLYQEMGRAGRDGLPSTCLLLSSGKDKGLRSYFIRSSEAPEEIKKLRWKNLDALIRYTEGSECRHAEVLTYFRDSQRLKRCGHCDNCDPSSERRIYQERKAVSNETAATKKVLSSKVKGVLKKSAALLTDLDPEEMQRFELLRLWRKKAAEAADAPAFMILSDQVLRNIVVEMPENLEDLSLIRGIGPAKLLEFGEAILAELKRGGD